jgi:hypothetical protein
LAIEKAHGFNSRDSLRLKQIDLVLQEKRLLADSAKKLLELVAGDETASMGLQIKQQTIDISNHLSSIASFCDNATKQFAERVTMLLGIMMLDRKHAWMYQRSIITVLPRLVAIQVDFTKDKFKIVNLDISLRELEAKLKLTR